MIEWNHKLKNGSKKHTLEKIYSEWKIWEWLHFLENLITELNGLIFSTKASYYENLGKKLNNPLLKAKTYWSILKTFYNDKKFH